VASFTVIYDACIFYPAPLRDLMIRLAMTRRFRAQWTDQIHDEWVNALLKNEPLRKHATLMRTVERINKAVPDCLVTGYGHLVDDLELPDANDRHVLAAAIRSGAAAIVTMNLRDFPAEVLSQFEIFAIHPDNFILDLADLEPEIVLTAAKEQRANLNNPAFSAEEFVERIRRQGLLGVAELLEKDIGLI
jgi:PIN domain